MSDANHDEQRGQMQSRDDFQPNVSQKLSAAAQQDSMSFQIHFQPAPSGMGQSPTLDMCTAEFPASSQPAPSLHQTCHWGDCQATFQTLPDLVAHVNLEHLQIPEAAPLGALSCLWRDCANPDSLPGPSTGSHLRDALTSHLFQDHLHVYCPSASASPLDPPSQGEQNGGVAEHSSALISYSTSDVLTSSATTHRCHWQGCSLEFALLDELTAHLAAAHVGSGRAHYECFWEGCERNGERGFTSKQKICRHLQVSTSTMQTRLILIY